MTSGTIEKDIPLVEKLEEGGVMNSVERREGL
jgi:hypothetical protein